MLSTHRTNLQSSSLIQCFERFSHLYHQVPSWKDDQRAKPRHDAGLEKFEDREYVCKSFTAPSWCRDTNILRRVKWAIKTPFEF